jgi:hypothetical protein
MHAQMTVGNTAEHDRLIDLTPNETARLRVTAMKVQKMLSDTNESTTGARG